MELAKTAKVELMAHAREVKEYKYLLSDAHLGDVAKPRDRKLLACLDWVTNGGVLRRVIRH